MAWVETRPGHWQRPIGENEAMIKMIGQSGRRFGKDTWSISVTASFTAHLEQTRTARTRTRAESGSLPQALRDGWKLLRFRHPSIAALAGEDSLEYEVPDSLELERWATESFILVHGESSPGDVVARLTPRRHAALYYLMEDSSVVLNMSHWRTDGIGAFSLLNAYFQAAVEVTQLKDPSDLAWGEEAARLVPSVEEALKLPQKPSPEIEHAAKRYLDTLAHNSGALGTPQRTASASGDDVVPGGTRSVDLRFSLDETARLEAECLFLGVRIESAVHASVAATAFSIAEPTSSHGHHASTLRHSLRPHLPAPYDGITGAAGLYTAGYIVKVPSSQSWIENARQYESEYAKGASADLISSRRQYAVVMKGILKNMRIPNPPPSGLDISCVPDAQGLVRSVHTSASGSLEVLDVGIGVDVLSRHVYVFMWTLNGKLALRLVYNEAFYSVSFAKSILALVKEHLVSNLFYSVVS